MKTDTNQIRIIKSEWHQVEKRYGMVLTKDDIELIYGEDEAEQRWQALIDGDLDPDDVICQGEDEGHYYDWDWLDEDDWWTDRKGGYDVTYEIEQDYEEPLQDWQIIQNLKLEVNALLAEKNEPKRYPEARTQDEIEQALQELKDEFDKLMDEESEDK